MNRLKAHIENIALSHSVFALPFAYMGAVLAYDGIPNGWDVLWITLAMIGARSAALALNNFIDLKYDRLQPRFAKRPLVTGAITPTEAALFTLLCLGLFFLAASQLHPLCIKLAPLAVIPLAVYPYMKRFSWTCHFVLGSALAIAPIGAWIAIRGEASVAVLLLGAAVGVWIAGFDIIYGCQDVEFDKRNNLYSVPVRFGAQGALMISRGLHLMSIILFILVGLILHLHLLYYIGVTLAALVLVYQHTIITVKDFSMVTQTYFMRNGLVSIFVLLFTLCSVVFEI